MNIRDFSYKILGKNSYKRPFPFTRVGSITIKTAVNSAAKPNVDMPYDASLDSGNYGERQ